MKVCAQLQSALPQDRRKSSSSSVRHAYCHARRGEGCCFAGRGRRRPSSFPLSLKACPCPPGLRLMDGCPYTMPPPPPTPPPTPSAHFSVGSTLSKGPPSFPLSLTYIFIMPAPPAAAPAETKREFGSSKLCGGLFMAELYSYFNLTSRSSWTS